jgi:hypothetical protein
VHIGFFLPVTKTPTTVYCCFSYFSVSYFENMEKEMGYICHAANKQTIRLNRCLMPTFRSNSVPTNARPCVRPPFTTESPNSRQLMLPEEQNRSPFRNEINYTDGQYDAITLARMRIKARHHHSSVGTGERSVCRM